MAIKRGFTIIIRILFLHRALTYPNLIAVLVLFVGKGSCDSSKCFKTQKALMNIAAFYLWYRFVDSLEGVDPRKNGKGGGGVRPSS